MSTVIPVLIQPDTYVCDTCRLDKPLVKGKGLVCWECGEMFRCWGCYHKGNQILPCYNCRTDKRSIKCRLDSI
jgi:hypothetical protein